MILVNRVSRLDSAPMFVRYFVSIDELKEWIDNGYISFT
jgi:hypothetical protein